MPRPDNAIYSCHRNEQGSAGVNSRSSSAIRRGAFSAGWRLRRRKMSSAVTALPANPEDKAADALVSVDPTLHSTCGTTCVATMLEGGHAMNAPPQRARAIVNCRIFLGTRLKACRRRS
ncbi:MAG: peptidase dimerization domain-containing protein [Sphingomonadales bacterium]|nr:peptidase dimerization domain-containing protein [Sphingomonadales bacterium]